MQKLTAFICITLIFLIFSNSSQAQLENLTFSVRAANFSFYDSINYSDPMVSGKWNIMEYDIFIQQTNTPLNDSEIMRLAFHQYYLNFNFGGLNSADTVGKYANLSYIPGSSTLSNLAALNSGLKCVAIASSIDQGAYWPSYPEGTLGGYLNLNSNSAMGSSSDVQISNIFPGTKVGRFKLKKNITSASPSPFFPQANPHIRWRIAPAITGTNSNPVSKVICYAGLYGLPTEVSTKGTYFIDSVLINPPIPQINLNVKLAVEGLYNPIFGKMARKDQVEILFRNTVSPYSIVESAMIYIDSNTFSGSYQTANVPYGTYYIEVKHLNSVEVWSKSGGIPFLSNNTVSYNFTSDKSRGYGDNLKLKGSYYCLYSGDIDQDGIIDASDLSIVSNAADSATSGYSVSDLNADLLVDARDLSMVENNIGNGIIAPDGSSRSKVIQIAGNDNSEKNSINP